MPSKGNVCIFLKYIQYLSLTLGLSSFFLKKQKKTKSKLMEVLICLMLKFCTFFLQDNGKIGRWKTGIVQ